MSDLLYNILVIEFCGNSFATILFLHWYTSPARRHHHQNSTKRHCLTISSTVPKSPKNLCAPTHVKTPAPLTDCWWDPPASSAPPPPQWMDRGLSGGVFLRHPRLADQCHSPSLFFAFNATASLLFLFFFFIAAIPIKLAALFIVLYWFGPNNLGGRSTRLLGPLGALSAVLADCTALSLCRIGKGWSPSPAEIGQWDW